eukprot:TRINITY_DN10022_c0_g1_i1.p1 TRINITY_DN10022_c0_g1~~TRINITY_DN10022_c0_g1_i1.p1  ORF type:complete len:679 (+),score=30.82 TRINITY_DN10022_c0_g1_i1:80-2116(+)
MNNYSSCGKFVSVCADTPIDHLSLLDPILGNTGCLRSANDVKLLVKYMETSSQMVSQCIVINILRNTRAPSTLERFVDSKGWAILSDWLKFAREKNEVNYLIELIHILLKFPQTIESLKQGGIGRNIKQLSRSKNIELQKSSKSVLIKWKKFLKDKQLPKSSNKTLKNTTKECVRDSNHELDFSKSDLNDKNLPVIIHTINGNQDKAVVRLDSMNQPSFRLMKTFSRDAKRIHTIITSDNNSKISPTLKLNERTTNVSSQNRDSITSPRCSSSDKPYSTAQDCVNYSSIKGLTSFNNRKLTRVRKGSSVESKKFSEAIFESTNRRSTLKRFSSTINLQRSGIERLSSNEFFTEDSLDRLQSTTDTDPTLSMSNPSNLVPFEAESQSFPKSQIHKRVTWAPGEFLTEVRFIELDDSDSSFIQVHGNFYDAIMEERKAERFALAHIFANDRMLALVQWNTPKSIFFLEPLVDPGCKSEELHCQNNRERSVLALLFLTKDSAPDDPGEPEIDEIQSFKEPKIIPLYEPGKEPLQENNSNSPVKSNISFPNIYTHSNFPRQLFTPVSQTSHDTLPLPYPSQYNILDTNIVSSLNPLSSETTKQFTFSSQTNNVATPSSVVSQDISTYNDVYPTNFPYFIPTESTKEQCFTASFSGTRRKNKIPCQHFIKGYCKKGLLCEYLH